MPPETNDDVILTAAKVEEWVTRRSQLMSELAELDKKIQAATILGYTPDSTPRTDEDESMPQAALRILAESDRAMTNQELMTALKQIPHFHERLTRNPNSFYNMLGRLARHERVERDGKRVKAMCSQRASG